MIKQLVILAGGNGSGKSTFYNLYLKEKGIHFINADEIAKRHFPGVFQRVQAGGHPVPCDKISSRLPRTFANIKEALKIVDTARLLDNSLGVDPFKVVALIEKQEIMFKASPFLDWAIVMDL